MNQYRGNWIMYTKIVSGSTKSPSNLPFLGNSDLTELNQSCSPLNFLSRNSIDLKKKMLFYIKVYTYIKYVENRTCSLYTLDDIRHNTWDTRLKVKADSAYWNCTMVCVCVCYIYINFISICTAPICMCSWLFCALK